ncbi:MAG TPA: hypothetical protein VIY09_07060 [Rhizomicrobium sp.]
MGALTLARLMGLEALRRPRAVLAVVMLALSAGFMILPSPGASYATLTFHRHPLIYTPAVMGFIAGGEFVAFAILLGMLAMSALSPLRAWRSVFGVAAAPGWTLALGLWLAGFGLGLFLLGCIFGGALLRASGVLGASGDGPGGLWTFFTWTFGLGVVGAAFAATVASVVALRLATRPALLMGATFLIWIIVLSALVAGPADVTGQGFGLAHLFPQTRRIDFSMGFVSNGRHLAGVQARAVGALPGASGGALFLLTRVAFVVAALLTALALSGPRVTPLVTRSLPPARGFSGRIGRLSARFGLAGVITSQIWRAPLWALALLVAAIAVETIGAGKPFSVIALGFAWGLYMLRWPELCEAFEQRALRSLVQPSVLGPWPIRLQIAINIALQMSLLALPLAIALAAAGRLHGLLWLAAQIAIAPLVCVGLARLRGGATIFSLAAMLWWYLMVSGNAPIPG